MEVSCKNSFARTSYDIKLIENFINNQDVVEMHIGQWAYGLLYEGYLYFALNSDNSLGTCIFSYYEKFTLVHDTHADLLNFEMNDEYIRIEYKYNGSNLLTSDENDFISGTLELEYLYSSTDGFFVLNNYKLTSDNQVHNVGIEEIDLGLKKVRSWSNIEEKAIFSHHIYYDHSFFE